MGYQDVRHHYEEGPEDAPFNPRERMHCAHCGAFLPARPDGQRDDPEWGWAAWWVCKRCGKEHVEQ